MRPLYLKTKRASHRARHSSALVITMMLVCLITVLLVGFVGSMRLEIFSARAQLNSTKATFYSQAAQDMAVSRLYYAMSSTNGFWVTQPGRATASISGSLTTVLLSSNPTSGAPATSASTNLAADFNVSSLEGSNGNLLALTNAVMRVQWMYVHQDGSYESGTPTISTANPVVGRFAFWVDDESTKINVNTAYTNNASLYPASHPGRVNLSTLSIVPGFADSVKTFRANNHYFNSSAEFCQSNSISGSIDAWKTNRFNLTHYNHSLEWNLFNEPRILLTAKKSIAEAIYGTGTTNYIRIVSNGSDDPGALAALNATSVSAVVGKIAAELNRTDWPIMTSAAASASFGGKFTPVRSEQIALNIVEYVRAAESTNNVVAPIWGSLASSGGVFAMSSAANGNLLIGNNRGPRITEIAVNSVSAPVGGYNVVTEIHLPRYFGLTSIDLSTLTLTVYLGYPSGTASFSGPWAASSTTLLAGNYASVTRTLSATAGLATVSVAAQLTDSAGQIVEIAPLSYLNATPGWINCTVSTANSMNITDPNLSRGVSNWTSAARTLGSTNSATMASVLTTGPLQDLTASLSGSITDVSMRFPVPSGTSGNAFGMVGSVGELGYVHTGNECVGVATPWRTIRLQPQRTSDGYLPDWAILDLFAAPLNVSRSDADGPYILPSSDTNSIGGKINVNAVNVTTVNSNYYSRLTPMILLFQGAANMTTASTTLSTTTASNMVFNIWKCTVAVTNTSEKYGSGFFYAPGQIVEVAGVADGGEATESRFRDVSSLITTRGNVFTIYSVGQVIKQDKSGNLNVMGEHRRATMVERVQSGSSGKFQIVYSQTLSP
jgi:hypothetical protein